MDLAECTMEMVRLREPETLAWTSFDPARLEADARAVAGGEVGPARSQGLIGIPFGVKDIFNTRAYPTQMGSSIWKDFTPGNNARVVDALLGAGAVVAGKTVTAEFAVHALNDTLNPHDALRTPGTSSSGSAAAVAAGMVPFALASQTAGSITRPASFCGVWGMKPSFGLIPRTGVLKTTDSLDTIGFVAAHGHSLRTILDAVRVRGPDYPFVHRNVDGPGDRPGPGGGAWRVGFVRTHVWEDGEAYAREALLGLVDRLGGESEFDLVEIDWPELLVDAHAIHETLYTKSLAYYFQQEAKASSYISPLMREMMAKGRDIDIETFRGALRRQEAMSDAVDELLAQCDLVVSLGTAGAAPLRGETESRDPSLVWTMTHVPSVVVPLFRSPDDSWRVAGVTTGCYRRSRSSSFETCYQRDVIP
ncbi:MAG: amidase [Candidatus Nanopelagicales bacterium]